MVASLFAQQDNLTVDFADVSFVAALVSLMVSERHSYHDCGEPCAVKTPWLIDVISFKIYIFF